jgi:hypothetical protein
LAVIDLEVDFKSVEELWMKVLLTELKPVLIVVLMERRSLRA